MVSQDNIVPTKISNLIANQFPAFYREQGPIFIAFVRAYYEWLESPTNPLYYSRRFYNIMDIDTTLDEFILHFKEKYLKDIQLTTKSDTRLLIKHALDIYRSKGTERCVQLLFQLVFNENVGFYYPSQDLFKLSDGIWFRPQYLDLSISENNINIVSKEIMGVNSGAVAFVDDVIRRRTSGGRLIDIAMISALAGNFQTGEKIIPTDNSIDIRLCPTITGSLTTIELSIDGSGQGYNTGDIVSVSSSFGGQGVARITSIANQSGVVEFSLVEGGWGYTANANIYISNVQLTISNVVITNTSAVGYFDFLETFTEPMAYLNYISANNIFNVGDNIFTYFGNGAVMGTGSVLTKNQTNTTAGTLLCSIYSGNIANTFYTTSNAVTANLAASNGYSDATATGKYIANNSQITLTVDNANNFLISEYVYQGSTSGILYTSLGSNLIINTVSGSFLTTAKVIGGKSGATANIQSIAVTVGLVNTFNTFVGVGNNIITSDDITGRVSAISTSGTGLSAAISNTLLFPETIAWANNLLSTYAGVAFNATAYGFPANPTANASNGTIASSLTTVNTTIGKISALILNGFGQNFLVPPLIVIDEPKISGDTRLNQILYISGSTASFIKGEEIIQASTNAIGIIMQGNTSVLFTQRDRYPDSEIFVVTTNTATQITGVSSGAVANVSYTEFDYSGTDQMGRNAVLASDFSTGNGIVLTADVIDSGFGYIEGEEIILKGAGSETALGISHLGKQGTGSGYYKKQGGVLSGSKKLFDGLFYQNYSYQIISRKMIDKYQKMIQQITHPAGTIMFGRFVHNNTDGGNTSISKRGLTIS